mgnify:CR=1 FL=1
MKRSLILALVAGLAASALPLSNALANTGKLFTITQAGSDLTITPTANHYYPSMGITFTSNHSATGCSPYANGFCLFAASKQKPATLSLANNTGTINGQVCLNGQARYSCQRFSITASGGNPPAPMAQCQGTGGACRVFVTAVLTGGDMSGFIEKYK